MKLKYARLERLTYCTYGNLHAALDGTENGPYNLTWEGDTVKVEFKNIKPDQKKGIPGNPHVYIPVGRFVSFTPEDPRGDRFLAKSQRPKSRKSDKPDD